MFKSLRKKLQGVSKQLEDELEAQLEDQLEAELEAELAKESAPAPEPIAEEPPVTEEAPTPNEPTPSPPVAQASEPEPPAAPAESAGEDEPVRTQKSSSVAKAPEPEIKRAPDATPAPEPTVPAPEAESEPRKKKEKQRAPPARKTFSDEEIERRLQEELEQAVSVQKDVEAVAAPVGATKFTINEQVLEDILWELELALLESDVAQPVVEAIRESVKEQLLSLSVGRGNAEEIVEKVLRTAIKRVLEVRPINFDEWLKAKLEEKKPVVLMFVGVNGTGKTTSIGRLAYRLQQQGISTVMAAGDTFRAGAIEQLSLHGDNLGVKVVKHEAGADPAAVAYDAIEHAKARRKDVVLLDTAGRMQTNTNLMDEMDKIRRVADPDLVIFVGDSLAGNDAVEQARRFDEVVDIGGAILTKVDVDAKGGAALSVAYTINKPLLFVGVGQEYPDLRPFDAAWLVERLFGNDEL